MLEIYKENLFDLLNASTHPRDIQIKEHPTKGIYVQNLKEEYISTKDEMLLLIEQAEGNRVVSETGLNKISSRSHMLLILQINQKMLDETEKKGTLYLVDLAGSEKVSKTKAVGETLEEAKKINLSLSTLGNVISSLTSENNKYDFVPYRDSKLTRILQGSLGGNYKTTLIVTCSPHIYNIEETISTLKFASRAKKIKNKVKPNIQMSTAQLEAIIDKLKKDLRISSNCCAKLKKLLLDKGIELNDLASILNQQPGLDDANIISNVMNAINLENMVVSPKHSVPYSDIPISRHGSLILDKNEIGGALVLENPKLIADNERLSIENSKLKDEIESLKNETDELKEKMSKTQVRDSITDQIEKLEKSLVKIIGDLNAVNSNQYKQECDQYKKENNDLRVNLDISEARFMDYTKKLDVIEKMFKTDLNDSSHSLVILLLRII